MRMYCEESRKYGEVPIENTEYPRKVTVILNPNANKRKATKLFESYCAPILNVAGMCVDVIQTQSEGHARILVEELKDITDGIIIAGGDGTISEVITGLIRRRNNDGFFKICPVGVLPLGRSNVYSTALFPNEVSNKTVRIVRSLADASIAIVKEQTKLEHLMKIEVIEPGEPNKPVYALSGIEWGAFRDAAARRDKYWYFGPLRNYATYIFSGTKVNLTWDCAAQIKYLPPCSGCSNCYITQTKPGKIQGRWWSSAPKQSVFQTPAAITNKSCGLTKSKDVSTVDFALKVSVNEEHGPPHLDLLLGPQSSTVSYTDFVTQGFKVAQGVKRPPVESLHLRQIEIVPQIERSETKESWYSIDKEDYEVRPIRVTIVPNAIKIFCNHK